LGLRLERLQVHPHRIIFALPEEKLSLGGPMNHTIKAVKDLLLDVAEVRAAQILIDVRNRVHNFENTAGPVAHRLPAGVARLPRKREARHQEKIADVRQLENLSGDLKPESIRILRLQKLLADKVQRLAKVSQNLGIFDRVIDIIAVAL